jgi:4-amino-4-deoxychorismate lyase
MSDQWVWINGARGQMLSAQDRGLMYGDGFFTTVRWEARSLLNWQAHLHRLHQSTSALGFAEDTPALVVEQLRSILPCLPDQAGIVRITLTRGAGARGYRPPVPASATCIVHFSPGLPQEKAPLTVGISDVLWAQPPQLAGIKHLNRLAQVLAAQRLPEGCDEALMQDSRHRLISGISSALVGRLGKTLYSPILDTAGVDSTTVSALRHAAQSLGWQWQTIHLPVSRLMQMEGVALLNAVRGLQPVACLQSPLEKCFDVDGWAPLSEALMQWQRKTQWRIG